MNDDANEAIVRRFYDEVVNAGNLAVLDSLCAPGFVERAASPTDLNGFKQFLARLAVAFPDLRVTVEDIFGQADKVAVRLTVRATHTGPLWGTIQPTNRSATWTGIDIFRIEAGRIAERWSQRDLLSLFTQLGVVNL